MKTYRAVVEARVPAAGANGTHKQMVTIPMVPCVGSFYATKALLEINFGPGSVKGLYENS